MQCARRIHARMIAESFGLKHTSGRIDPALGWSNTCSAGSVATARPRPFFRRYFRIHVRPRNRRSSSSTRAPTTQQEIRTCTPASTSESRQGVACHRARVSYTIAPPRDHDNNERCTRVHGIPSGCVSRGQRHIHARAHTGGVLFPPPHARPPDNTVNGDEEFSRSVLTPTFDHRTRSRSIKRRFSLSRLLQIRDDHRGRFRRTRTPRVRVVRDRANDRREASCLRTPNYRHVRERGSSAAAAPSSHPRERRSRARTSPTGGGLDGVPCRRAASRRHLGIERPKSGRVVCDRPVFPRPPPATCMRVVCRGRCRRRVARSLRSTSSSPRIRERSYPATSTHAPRSRGNVRQGGGMSATISLVVRRRRRWPRRRDDDDGADGGGGGGGSGGGVAALSVVSSVKYLRRDAAVGKSDVIDCCKISRLLPTDSLVDSFFVHFNDANSLLARVQLTVFPRVIECESIHVGLGIFGCLANCRA